MDMLSKGIDPIGGEAVPGDSVLNNERLQKCFVYVCGVLQKVINNGGEVAVLKENRDFSLSEEQKRNIPLDDEPMSGTDFVRRINYYTDCRTMKRLTGVPIYKWLLEHNYLTENKVSVQSVKTVRALTETSQSFGLSIRQTVVKTTGETKEEIVFSKAAQAFILEHLNEIIC